MTIPTVNLSATERWASSITGALMTLSGLRERSFRGTLMAVSGVALVARGATGHCPIYAAVGHSHGRVYDTREALGGGRGIHVDESFIINRSPDELYALWRSLERLPQYIPALTSVVVVDATHSHWEAVGVGGRRVQWDAEILNDIRNELIAWRTVGEPDVVSAGSVHFVPTKDGRETQVRVRLQYQPPGGKSAAALARLLGKEPGQMIRDGLRRFKAVLETGEVPTTDGQPRGQRSILNYA